MKKRTRGIFLFMMTCLMMAVFVGWGKQPVELFKKGSRLIDLDVALEQPDWGQNGNTDKGGDSSLTDPDGGESEWNKEMVHKIRIRTEDIYYRYDDTGEVHCQTVEQLQEILSKKCQEGDTIELVDDYAEAKRYREVLQMLEELSAEKGYPYSAD